MTTISRQEAIDLMTECHNFFTVTFVKRTTGELRTMNCRTGVKKYVTGVGMKYNPREKNLLPVWERRSDGEGAENYRNVNLNDLVTLVINKQHYEVV